jgi:hypothetical protein
VGEGGNFFVFLYVSNDFLATLPKAPQFLSHHSTSIKL